MTKSEMNRRMREFQVRCRELGISVTYQRLSIYKALLELEGHPCPDDVFQLVRRDYPSISLATIYKTLERLERLAIITKPMFLHETARYEHRTDHHHHLVCTECRHLEDVRPEALGSRLPREVRELGVPEALLKRFEVSDYSITFKGLCKPCKRKRGAEGPAQGGAIEAAAAHVEANGNGAR